MPRVATSPTRTITVTLSYEEVAGLVLLWKRKSETQWRADVERLTVQQDRDGMAELLKDGTAKLLVEFEAALARAV